MTLFDTNIAIYAYRAESRDHGFYLDWFNNVHKAGEVFFYSEWVLSSFIRIVTNPRIFPEPSPVNEAFRFADRIRDHPRTIRALPGPNHWSLFRTLCERTQAQGKLVPDAYLAALAIDLNAEWITADNDFAMFEPDLRWRLLRPSN
ncbi:MAG: TA system VapC family ribonuclease toxin [Candidatus Hydrogenedentota bacterium]